MSEKLVIELVAIDKATAPVRKVKQAVAELDGKFSGSARGVNQFGTQSDAAARKLQKFTQGALQQAGYQVGDFAVQVANGTSWMQAFGQQGSQLLGIFGHWGAVAGAVVSIGAAIGVAFQKTSQNAKSLKDNITELEAALSKYKSAAELSSSTSDDLAQKFGNASDKLRTTLQLLEQISSQQLQRQIDNTAASLTALTASGGSGEARMGIADLFDVNIMSSAQREARKLTAEYLNASRALDASKGNAQKQADAVQRMLVSATALANMDGKITLAEEEHLSQLSSVLSTLNEVNNTAAKNNGEYAKAVAINKQMMAIELGHAMAVSQAEAKRLASANQIHNHMIAMQSFWQQHNKAAASYDERLKSAYITYGMLRRAGEAIVTVTQSAAFAAQQFADNAAKALAPLAAIQSTLANLKVSNIGKAAQLAALQAGKSSAEAQMVGEIASERARLGPSLGSTDRAARMQAVRDLDAFISRKQEELSTDTQINAIIDARTKAEQEAAKAAKNNPLGDLLKQLALEEELTGKTEAQRRVISALGTDYMKYGATTIQALVDQINKTDELNKEIEQQKQIADTIRNSMEDAFMSMVDGTSTVEDAFKNMAASIIKELYRVLVVQQAVNAIMGVVGKVFPSLAPVAGARASGGPVTGGRPYLVGEKGPEIVVPGRSGTVIPNGTSMGGSVTVNQNISFGSGVTRAEVNAMIPKIVEATKQAVADASRRGGSYGRAFA